MTTPTREEIAAPTKAETLKVLRAIAEGYPVRGEDDHLIVVENPDRDRTGWEDPNLVLDVDTVADLLRRLDAPAPVATPPEAGEKCRYCGGWGDGCDKCNGTGRAPSDADAQRVERALEAYLADPIRSMRRGKAEAFRDGYRAALAAAEPVRGKWYEWGKPRACRHDVSLVDECIGCVDDEDAARWEAQKRWPDPHVDDLARKNLDENAQRRDDFVTGYHAALAVADPAQPATEREAFLADILQQHICNADGAMTVSECVETGRCRCSCGIVIPRALAESRP